MVDSVRYPKPSDAGDVLLVTLSRLDGEAKGRAPCAIAGSRRSRAASHIIRHDGVKG